jgi:hypothetical protein
MTTLATRFGKRLLDKGLRLPLTQNRYVDDATIISERPREVFLRPSNSFRPDILAFLGSETMLSVRIKLYASNTGRAVPDDNLASNNPALHFVKGNNPANEKNRELWVKSFESNPINKSIRILIELPEPVDCEILSDSTDSIVISVTKANMHQLFSSEACQLINCIIPSSV